MKKYTRTQEVEAIQWKGDNKSELKIALGKGFIVEETNTDSLNIKVSQKGSRDIVHSEVLKDSWVILHKYGWGFGVMLNEVFKKEFVVSKEKSEGTE